MISSKTGILAPTKPVFPPYGTMGNFLWLQYFNISAISSVEAGLSINFELPMNFFDQSILAATRSSGSFTKPFGPRIRSNAQRSFSVGDENAKFRSTAKTLNDLRVKALYIILNLL